MSPKITWLFSKRMVDFPDEGTNKFIEALKDNQKPFLILGDSSNNIMNFDVSFDEVQDADFIIPYGSISFYSKAVRWVNHHMTIKNSVFDQTEPRFNCLMNQVDFDPFSARYFMANNSGNWMHSQNPQWLPLMYLAQKPDSISYPVFCRPDDSTKAFPGQVFYSSEDVDVAIKTYHLQFDDIFVMTAPMREIEEEYRFWIRGNDIVARSDYSQHDIITPGFFLNEAAEWLTSVLPDIYKPYDMFVVDVAKNDSGYGIIEYNCVNTSGVYGANVYDLIDAMEASAKEYMKHIKGDLC